MSESARNEVSGTSKNLELSMGYTSPAERARAALVGSPAARFPRERSRPLLTARQGAAGDDAEQRRRQLLSLRRASAERDSRVRRRSPARTPRGPAVRDRGVSLSSGGCCGPSPWVGAVP